MSYKVGENSYALEEAGEGGGDYQQQQYGDYEQQGQEQNDPQYSGYEQQGQELNDPQYSGYEQQDQQYGGYEQPPQQQYGNYDQQQQYGEYADDQQPPQHLEQEPSRESFIDRESFVDTSIVLLDDGRTQKSTMNSTYGNRAVSPGKAPINLGVDSKGDDEDIENKAVGGPFDKFNMEPPQGM